MRTGPSSALALAAAGLPCLSCQVVFGLDGYELAEQSAGGAAGAGGSGASGGAGGSGLAPSSSSSAGGGAVACPKLEPVEIEASGGLCGVRRLDALATPTHEKSPGAFCNAGGACQVYFQVGNGDSIGCAACPDLAAGECNAVKTVPAPAFAVSPYPREYPSQLWLSYVAPGDDDYDIHFAPLPASCTVGAYELALPAAPSPGYVSGPDNELFPAISPNGRLLFFTRCGSPDPDSTHGPCRIYVARRAGGAGPFGAPVLVAGIGTRAGTEDSHPQPVWADGGEAVHELYFTSTRDAPTVTVDPDELDVFVARRPPGSAWDAPFTDVERVDALSSEATDFAPVPVTQSTWLWSRFDGVDSDLYLVDVGCVPRFQPPDPGPFAAVNTPDHERAPALLQGGGLLLARGATAGALALHAAPGPAGAWGPASPVTEPPIDPLAGSFDTDPAPAPGGDLLFVSDRGTPGLPKLWRASAGAAPERVTAEPTFSEETPFVDADGALWLSWGGADSKSVIARAAPDGSGGWVAELEIPELGHQEGRRDSHPRLSADGLTLFFVSKRDGGFAAETNEPGAPFTQAIWVATRATREAGWDAPFPLPELGSVNGVADPWIGPDECSLTVASRPRGSGFKWDLMSADRIARSP